jgi:excinuclease ABC subunit A
MAPLDRYHNLQSVKSHDLAVQLQAQGFTRVYQEGEKVLKISDLQNLVPLKTHVVVDRVKVHEKQKGRLFEAVQLAFKVGGSQISFMGESPGDELIKFRNDLTCPTCQKSYLEPSMALMSFNNPLGACPACQGFGRSSELDWQKVIPSMALSLAEEGVSPWNFGQFREYYSWAKQNLGPNIKLFEKKFAQYTPEDWHWLKEGKGRSFDGIHGFFKYLESKKYKPHYRMHLARFKKYETCKQCRGARLSPASLAVKVLGLNLAEVHSLKLGELGSWVTEIKQKKAAAEGAAHQRLMGLSEALDDLESRLTYLNRLGLSYLTADRPGRSISGGELQRIHLGRCLGSALFETLYCLDEPTSGLHPRDGEKLLGVIQELCQNNNTIVMVEHDFAMIEGSDSVIEIGPKAGAEGGQIIFEGTAQEWVRRMRIKETAPIQRTDAKLRDQHQALSRELKATTRFINLSHGKIHNLKDVSIKIPLGQLTVVCGVSGSGKTSLVEHSIYPALQGVFEGSEATGESPLLVEPNGAVQVHRGVLMVSQSALARSSRSNIATYLGLMDEIRKLFAKEPLAKNLGLTPGSFSFNTPGGRCETCKGLGTVVEDLSFLGEVEVLCPSCHGRRFDDRVLQVSYKGYNLNQIFGLTVRQARDVFADRPPMRVVCDRVCELGLGYITLGQHTSGFSGGEAQRLKLLSMTAETDDLKPMILIFDEPTRGLSQVDVMVFLQHLRRLTRSGHTLIVVEHHLDVIRTADWLIEVGPEAGEQGGEIVFMGPVEALIKAQPNRSQTVRYLH